MHQKSAGSICIMWVLSFIISEPLERRTTFWKGPPFLRDNADINSLTAGHPQLEEPGDHIRTSSPAVVPESSEDWRRPKRPRRKCKIPITTESINGLSMSIRKTNRYHKPDHKLPLINLPVTSLWHLSCPTLQLHQWTVPAPVHHNLASYTVINLTPIAIPATHQTLSLSQWLCWRKKNRQENEDRVLWYQSWESTLHHQRCKLSIVIYSYTHKCHWRGLHGALFTSHEVMAALNQTKDLSNAVVEDLGNSTVNGTSVL